MKKYLLDANVLLEVLLGRKESLKCQSFIDSDNELFLSALSIHVIYYITSKQGLSHESIRLLISKFTIVPIGLQEYEFASVINQDKDIEDAFQIASSVLNKCDAIVTLDKKIKKKYGEMCKVILV